MKKKTEKAENNTQAEIQGLICSIQSMKCLVESGELTEDDLPTLEKLERRLFELTSSPKMLLINELKRSLEKPINNLDDMNQAIACIVATATTLSIRPKGRPAGSKNKKR